PGAVGAAGGAGASGAGAAWAAWAACAAAMAAAWDVVPTVALPIVPGTAVPGPGATPMAPTWPWVGPVWAVAVPEKLGEKPKPNGAPVPTVEAGAGPGETVDALAPNGASAWVCAGGAVSGAVWVCAGGAVSGAVCVCAGGAVSGDVCVCDGGAL